MLPQSRGAAAGAPQPRSGGAGRAAAVGPPQRGCCAAGGSRTPVWVWGRPGVVPKRFPVVPRRARGGGGAAGSSLPPAGAISSPPAVPVPGSPAAPAPSSARLGSGRTLPCSSRPARAPRDPTPGMSRSHGKPPLQSVSPSLTSPSDRGDQHLRTGQAPSPLPQFPYLRSLRLRAALGGWDAWAYLEYTHTPVPSMELESSCPPVSHGVPHHPSVLQCPTLSCNVHPCLPESPLLPHEPCCLPALKALGRSPTQALLLWGAPTATGGWIPTCQLWGTVPVSHRAGATPGLCQGAQCPAARAKC